MNFLKRFKVKRLKKFGNSLQKNQFRLTICDTNLDLLRHFLNIFNDTDQVEVVAGSLIDISCDAIVSPAACYGSFAVL